MASTNAVTIVQLVRCDNISLGEVGQKKESFYLVTRLIDNSLWLESPAYFYFAKLDKEDLLRHTLRSHVHGRPHTDDRF